ncbi:MAG: periplasmic heavy metal sensor [Desulfobaccales bacterium]
MARLLRQHGSLVALAALLVVALAWPAAAQPGRGRGMMAQLTPEQAAQVFDLRQKFMNDTAALRKEMFVKRAELMALWQAENPDEKAITAKLKELNALKGQLIEKGVAHRLALKKIAPQAAMWGMGGGWGCGMGMGMGKGWGMGPGMGRGMGPGPMSPPGPGPRSDVDLGFGEEVLAFEPGLE